MAAVLFAGALGFIGCSKSERATDSHASGDLPVSPSEALSAQQPISPVGPAAVVATNAVAPDFQRVAMEEAFSLTDGALKETSARAIIAYQIGDYARAVTELEDLGNNAELSAEQKYFAQDLLTKARQMAPETVKAQKVEASPAAANFVVDTAEDPFASADPAVKEDYARATIAYTIGDYARAESEFKDLAANSRLTPGQRNIITNFLTMAQKTLPKEAPKP